MITEYQWIDDNSELEQLILLRNPVEAVAFDSEFERVSSYFPKPALFQLKIGQRYFLIDMKKINHQQVLLPLLDNIILHSGSEDLEILYLLNHSLPSRVFDTQIAASLCGYGLHFSYQNMVKELFQIELPKAHSRSDWMQRPLSSEQIQYALEDVIYLDEIQHILTQKLTDLGRLSWFELLTKQRLDAVINNQNIEKTFVKIATSCRLKNPQQQLLYALLNWREELAIKRDKPRQWILKNEALVNIIFKKPLNESQFIQQIGLYPKFVQYHAKSIIDLYTQVEDVPIENLPAIDKLTPNQGQKLKQMKKNLNEACTKLNIPPALIINVTDLQSLAAADKDLSNVPMWQLIAH